MKRGFLILALLLMAPPATAQDATTHASPMDETMMVETERLDFCPQCNAQLAQVPILYGKITPHMIGRAKRGEIVLGGRNADPQAPNTASMCPECKEVVDRFYAVSESQAGFSFE